MPKPSLYAGASTAFTAATLCLIVAGGPAYGQTQPSPPCAACIVLVASPGQTVLLPDDLRGMEVVIRPGEDAAAAGAALRQIRQRQGRPGLWLAGVEDRAATAETLALVDRVVVDLLQAPEGSDLLAFRLKSFLAGARSATPDGTLGVVARAEVIDDLMRRDLGPYLDFAGTTASADPPFPLLPAVRVIASTVPVGEWAGTRAVERWMAALPGDALSAANVLRDMVSAFPLLPHGLIAGGRAVVRCRDRELPTFLNPQSLDSIAIVSGCRPDDIVVSGAPAADRVVLTEGSVIVRVPAADGVYAEGVRVDGTRTMTVGEIIARHQAAASRQRRLIRRQISTGRMTLTFEAPGFPAPLTITSRSTLFVAAGVTEIEQRDVRINGIVFGDRRVPRLPLLEPERVASPPLAIELTDVYRYALEGQEVIDGASCYVVSFEPIDRRRPLFAGRAWVAADGFGLVKVSAVQTGLRGAIVTSQQTDEFRRDAGGLWLLGRSEVHQIYEGAGHRTPILRVLTVDVQEINPEGFDDRRRAAYASPSIILRDTAAGYRYVRRERDEESGQIAGVPTVAAPSQRIRTVAVGVIVDPNISRPLPFAGLSYVDFNLFGTGTQLNGFFGGTYGQLAVAVPSLAGSRWQLGGRAFAIASSYNDRAFVDGREDYRANVSQRPAHASAWLLRPLTSRVTMRAGYEFDYTAFDRVDSTAITFVVPAAQSAHAFRSAIEAQWAGWSTSLWWSVAARHGWRFWGDGRGDYAPRHRDYQRVGANVSRSFVLWPRVVARTELAWMGGRDLDRFSRYAFGSFENRLHGYPSALIRYDRGGVWRNAVGWAAGSRLRLDGFLDVAYVRDPGFGPSSKAYTGTGVAAEVPAPFGTLLAVEWGYGFQGVDDAGRRGTQVVRISGYKMF